VVRRSSLGLIRVSLPEGVGPQADDRAMPEIFQGRRDSGKPEPERVCGRMNPGLQIDLAGSDVADEHKTV
jgi:hypothetical protein